MAWSAFRIPRLLLAGVPDSGSGETGDGVGEGQSCTQSPLLHAAVAPSFLFGAAVLPLALYGIPVGAVLPFHLGQVAQGVHVGLFYRPLILFIAAVCTALCTESPGAKKGQAAEVPLTVLYDCMSLHVAMVSTPPSMLAPADTTLPGRTQIADTFFFFK